MGLYFVLDTNDIPVFASALDLPRRIVGLKLLLCGQRLLSFSVLLQANAGLSSSDHSARAYKVAAIGAGKIENGAVRTGCQGHRCVKMLHAKWPWV